MTPGREGLKSGGKSINLNYGGTVQKTPNQLVKDSLDLLRRVIQSVNNAQSNYQESDFVWSATSDAQRDLKKLKENLEILSKLL